MATAEKLLALRKQLEEKGLDDRMLQEITDVINKYGGREKFFAAFNAYRNLSQIKAASRELEAKIDLQKITLAEMEAQESSLKSAIEMCHTLLFEYKTGPGAINAILDMAKIYGEPIEVLKAIEAYGSIQALVGEGRRLKAAIEQLKEVENEYASRVTILLEQIEKVNTKALELGRATGVIEQQLKQESKSRDILNLLQNPMAASFDQHAPLALAITQSLRTWVNQNKDKFRMFYDIDRGLENLSKNLGGR